MSGSDTAISVYFAAGISMFQTSEMFIDAMNHMENRYRSRGFTSIRTHCFYPYGTMDDIPASRHRRFMTKQAFMVGRDIYRQAAHTVGGRALFNDIRQHYDRLSGGDIVLIGHSGGGIASYKAAQLLHSEGYPVIRIFMVGSPEIPICANCRDKVFTIEHGGRGGDWISRCAFHWFRPAKVRVRLPINGGHPDYFCHQSRDENNVSNMEKVMDFIWSWVQRDSGFVYNGINT